MTRRSAVTIGWLMTSYSGTCSEILGLAKKLEGFKCEFTDKFVAESIISMLPSTWRDFATSQKHKRQMFSVVDMIGFFDVEENTRAKDTPGKEIMGAAGANFVQKKIISEAPMGRRSIQRLNRQWPLRRMVVVMCAVNLDT
jgi:hypothetical protein